MSSGESHGAVLAYAAGSYAGESGNSGSQQSLHVDRVCSADTAVTTGEPSFEEQVQVQTPANAGVLESPLEHFALKSGGDIGSGRGWGGAMSQSVLG